MKDKITKVMIRRIKTEEKSSEKAENEDISKDTQEEIENKNEKKYKENEENEECKYEEDEYEEDEYEKNIYYDKLDKFSFKNKAKKKSSEIILTDVIKEKNKIIVYKEKIYVYQKNKGYYKSVSDHEIKVIIRECIDKEYSKQLTESKLYYSSKLLYTDPELQANKNIINKDNLINCLNCTIDMKNNSILDHDEKYMFFNVLNVKYKKYSDEKLLNKYKESKFSVFINNITDNDYELKMLIQEVFGYCISNYNNAKSFFILYGNSNTGKSVFLDLLIDIVGIENTTNIELQNLSKDVYVAELQNKKLNVCNELPDTGLKDLGKIKSLVSNNDIVQGCLKFKAPVYFRNEAKLIFATNNLPTINNKSLVDNTAFFNRLVIIPFLNQVPIEYQDRDLINKLKKEKNIIFMWALSGLERYISNGYRFSNCKISRKYLDMYINKESIIERFINERIRFSEQLNENVYIFKSDLENEFERYCIDQVDPNLQKKYNRELKKILIEKYEVDYSRLNKGPKNNKYGFKYIYLE